MTNKQEAKFDLGKVLTAAAQVPANMTLRDFNPLEQFPCLAVGEEITPGTVINGIYEGTERIASHKFKSAERDPATGKPIQLLHKMRLNDGQVIGIWSTGELKMVFEKLSAGDFISLKYINKGVNSAGNSQHFFEYKRGEVAN